MSINLSGGGGVGGSPPFHNQIMFHTSTLTYINIIPLFASLRFASLAFAQLHDLPQAQVQQER